MCGAYMCMCNVYVQVLVFIKLFSEHKVHYLLQLFIFIHLHNEFFIFTIICVLLILPVVLLAFNLQFIYFTPLLTSFMRISAVHALAARPTKSPILFALALLVVAPSFSALAALQYIINFFFKFFLFLLQFPFNFQFPILSGPSI